VLFTVGLLAFTLAADPSDSAAAKASIDRMRADLTYLSSTELEGRGITTAGIVKAAEHIRNEFKKLGLKSGTADGSYFQPFEYGEKHRIDPAKTSLVIGGKKLEPGKDYSPFASGATTEFKGGVVFAGYGITMEGGKYDDYKGIDAAGKVVIVFRRTPRQGVKNDPVFNENAQARYAPIENKVANAVSHKAAALLIVNDPFTAKDGAADKLEDVNFLGRSRQRLPLAQITQAAADALLASTSLKSVKNAAEMIEKELKPQSAVLTDAGEASGKFEFIPESMKLNNVVGVIEGAGPNAHETVVIGAHYDHVGYGQFGSLGGANARNRVHHGADDNGSGTTALLEVARRFANRKSPPPRRLVFIAFSAEESGLVGSKHYASKDPLFPIKDTAAMLNMDMVGRLRDDKLEIAGNKSAKEFEPLLQELNSTAKFDLKLGPASIRGDSDHASFSNVGVPCIFFFTGTHPQYHRPTDTVDLINFEGMHRIVDLAEALVEKLAAIPKPAFIQPPRSPFAMLGGGRRRTNSPTLGIMPAYNTTAKGVEIEDVREGGPALKAGLKKGDVITEIGADKIENMDAYMAAMGKFKFGDKAKLKVKRGTETLTVEVELVAPPAAPKTDAKKKDEAKKTEVKSEKKD
jgi:Zn-dependent M28 family amino/carboxypeptidase